MSQLSQAITAKQAEITKLQADVEALQRVASIIGGKQPTTAKPKRRRRKMSAAARKAMSKTLKAHWAKKHTTAKPKRSKMSAAARKAVSKRMKAMWAAKRKAKK